jgi:hypothetical protein
VGTPRAILKLRRSSAREGLLELLNTLIASWRRMRTIVTEHSGGKFTRSEKSEKSAPMSLKSSGLKRRICKECIERVQGVHMKNFGKSPKSKYFRNSE